MHYIKLICFECYFLYGINKLSAAAIRFQYIYIYSNYCKQNNSICVASAPLNHNARNIKVFNDQNRAKSNPLYTFTLLDFHPSSSYTTYVVHCVLCYNLVLHYKSKSAKELMITAFPHSHSLSRDNIYLYIYSDLTLGCELRCVCAHCDARLHWKRRQRASMTKCMPMWALLWKRPATDRVSYVRLPIIFAPILVLSVSLVASYCAPFDIANASHHSEREDIQYFNHK